MKARWGQSASLVGSLIFMLLLFVQCDEGDGYVYPSVITDFMDLYNNESHMIETVLPDGSVSALTLADPISGKALKADTVYRYVGKYSIPDSDGQTALYALEHVVASSPVSRAQIGDQVLQDDPLGIESVYRGGNYLNIVALPLGQTHQQFFDFVYEGTVQHADYRMVSFTLSHDQNNDRESFPRRKYLSIPLREYDLRPGDSISLRVNLYEVGTYTWRVAY